MGLRPAKCYRKHSRPYTRISIRRPRKSYVKGVPKPKITGFEFGQKGDYKKVVYLISKQTIQIRHNAMEAARICVVKEMETSIKTGFFFKIRVFPHHVMRENHMATGAGADRFQSGMRQSFGRPIGMAAQIKEGQKVMEIRVNDEHVKTAKLAFKKAIYKLPMLCKLLVEDLK
jgi:large subunit ribosomal protein L10e